MRSQCLAKIWKMLPTYGNENEKIELKNIYRNVWDWSLWM
jgi:hypothetical protein